MELAANLFGYLGIASTLFIYLQKQRKHLLLWKLICDLFWLAYYGLVGASSAMAVTLAALIRTAVFMNGKRAWAQGKRWLYVFLAVSVAFSVIGWEGYAFLFTLLGSVGFTFPFWCETPKQTRLISIPSCLLYLIYYLYAGSVQATICEIFILVSSVIGLIRHDRKRSPKYQEDLHHTPSYDSPLGEWSGM